MNTVTESIYSGKGVIVPLADVQHIETHNPAGLIVVTKHTRWDRESDGWANSIWIDGAEATAFKAAWCHYRSELEADTLADLTPSPTKDRVMAEFDRAIGMLKG
jgi:hypothetical protein